MKSVFDGRRKTGIFLSILFLLTVLFSTWVTTAPEFRAGANRTLVERWAFALKARLGLPGDFTLRPGSRKRLPSTSGKIDKPPIVVGPATVLVVDTRGKPVADATVLFRSSSNGTVAKEQTRVQGSVQTRLPVGEYQLSISHPKYSPQILGDQRVVGPDRGITVHVVLETKVVVKGMVVDEEGAPVAGVAVAGQRNWLQQFAATASVFLDDAAYPTVSTDARGNFQLDDVSIGNNSFTATLRAYAPLELHTDVPAGGLASPLKLVLKRPSHISGQIMDEARQPVQNVKVTAVTYQGFGGPSVELPAAGYSTSSGSHGQFSLPKLFSNGYYHLRFEHPAYAVMEQSYVTADTDGVNIVMQNGGEVSGNVLYIDRPSTAAHVLLQAIGITGSTTITRSIMTEASGKFGLFKLPYGAYDLSVNSDGIVSEPRSKISSVKDKPTTNVLVEVYQASRLAGTVVDAATGDEIPGADVVVKATYGYGAQRVRQFSRKAGGKGEFAFENLPGGVHEITARAKGFLPTSGNAADYTVPLDAGVKLEDYTVFLSRGGTLKGQVVNADGQGIGDSEVQLYVASGSFSGLSVKDLHMTTDGSGFFEFRGFPIGQRLSVYVSAHKEGYAKKHSDLVQLSPDQPEITTKVVLTPGGVVSGKITDTQGNPLYGVKVTFDSREFPGDPSTLDFYTFTDAAGNYLLERCSPGRATLVADHEDYVRQIRSVTILESRLLSRQNFKMQLSRNIQGTVADFNGHPMADASVTAAPLSKSVGSGTTKTDKKGAFLLKGLASGTFRLEASFTLDTPDGKQAYTFINPEVPVGSVAVPIDCDVAPEALGTVLGYHGKGVDIFTVTLRSQLNTEPRQQFRFNLTRKYSSAHGKFRILQIPRGVYTLKLEAPGFETWESDEVIVGPGNRTRLPTIRMKDASQIVGTLVSSTTGKPVQGALVRVLDDTKKDVLTVNRIELAAYDRNDIIEYLDAAFDDDYKYDPDPLTRPIARVRGNVVTTRNSNAYGKFNIDDLAAGLYTIEIEHPSYRPKRVRNISVSRDKASDLGQVDLEPGGTLKGRVLDLEGNGISNASVQVKGELQGRNRARTDVAGNFELRGLAYGDWPVSVQSTLNNRQVYAWKKISIRPDETSLVEFVLETSADVRGRVLLPGGVPKIGTVHFYVVDETGTVMNDIAYTGSCANGNYSILGIPPGRYFTVVNGKGPNGNFTWWQWLDVNRGRNNENLSGVSASLRGTAIDVLGGGGVRGAQIQTVVDVTGVIVPGVIQDLLRLGVSTDAKGLFNFPYIMPGTHRIWAGGPGRQVMPVDAISIQPGASVKDYKVAVQAGP